MLKGAEKIQKINKNSKISKKIVTSKHFLHHISSETQWTFEAGGKWCLRGHLLGLIGRKLFVDYQG